MTAQSTARIATPLASRYLQQLCKHFAHKMKVEFTPEHGRIELRSGVCVLDAEPGDYLIEVRKAKGKPNWFLGAISDENARTFTESLSFLDAGRKYLATIYRDADNAD
mgnify:CR=1 FL=1